VFNILGPSQPEDSTPPGLNFAIEPMLSQLNEILITSTVISFHLDLGFLKHFYTKKLNDFPPPSFLEEYKHEIHRSAVFLIPYQINVHVKCCIRITVITELFSVMKRYQCIYLGRLQTQTYS
jgi:hypothetical protein